MASEEETFGEFKAASSEHQRPWLYRTWICAFIVLLCLSAGGIMAIAFNYGINNGVMAAILLSLLLGLIAAATVG